MEEPREITLEMFQCSDEVLDSLEELQYKVEELQLFCEGCSKNNEELQRAQTEKEREFKLERKMLNEEILKLRDMKLHILRENIMKECAVTPRWFNSLTKSINQEKKITELDQKLDNVRLELMEKDEIISSLQWELKNSTATMSILKADRTRLAAEIDAMTIRLEEYEYNEHFRRHNYDSGNHESASMYSNDDEAASFSDKTNQLDSRNSYVGSDDGSSGVGTLKRAANFSNINALNESADFQIASSTILSDPFTETSIHTTSTLLVSPDVNCQKDSNGDSIEYNDRINYGRINENLDTRNKDAKIEPNSQDNCDWETFEISGTDEEAKNKNKQPENKAEQIVIDEDNNDPWVSPCSSPILPKFNRTDNPFWDSIENSTKLPFFIPKDDNQNEIFTNYDQGVLKDNLEVPDFSFSNSSSSKTSPNLESTPSKSAASSSTKNEKQLTHSFNFFGREKSNSWNADNRGRVRRNLLRGAESKDDLGLWDFEPDSIIDVSTGETIYDSHCLNKAKKDTPRKSTSQTENSVTEVSMTEPSTLQNSSETQDIENKDTRLVNNDEKLTSGLVTDKQDTEDSSKKTTSKLNIDLKSNESQLSSSEVVRAFAKKGSKKQRKALGDFVNWKSQGKQGKPPANLTVSLC